MELFYSILPFLVFKVVVGAKLAILVVEFLTFLLEELVFWLMGGPNERK